MSELVTGLGGCGWGEVDPSRNDGKMSSSLILEMYLAPKWHQWNIEMAS